MEQNLSPEGATIAPPPTPTVPVAPNATTTFMQKNGPLLIGVGAVVVIFGGILAWVLWQGATANTKQPTPTATPLVTTEVPTTVIPTASASPTVTATVTTTPTATSTAKATITGGLTWPSEFIPPMNVCAVNTTTKKETCVSTKTNVQTFSIQVNPGSYVVYSAAPSQDNTKAYYTQCDTYDPESTTYQSQCTNDSWNSDSFKCYNDTTCKAAFTPLIITVQAGEKKQLQKISQGWYIPCNESGDTCNSKSYNAWGPYMPF